MKKQIALISAGLVLAGGLTSAGASVGQTDVAEAAQSGCAGYVALYSAENRSCYRLRHVNHVRGQKIYAKWVGKNQRSIQSVCNYRAYGPYVEII